MRGVWRGREVEVWMGWRGRSVERWSCGGLDGWMEGWRGGGIEGGGVSGEEVWRCGWVVVPEKSRAHTPSWWNPLSTDMGFSCSVSQIWTDESRPTCTKPNTEANTGELNVHPKLNISTQLNLGQNETEVKLQCVRSTQLPGSRKETFRMQKAR